MLKLTEKEMNAILEKFDQEYTFLYDHRDNVAGFMEAVNFFDNHLKDENFKSIVAQLTDYRKDFFSSDREAGAVCFALESLGYLDKLGL